MTATAPAPDRYNASLLVERNIEAGRGEKPAFVAADATLTYEQLRRGVNRAGRYLRELGVRREDRVLLVLDDTTVFPLFFLGAMRIGAVPVPVSPLDKTENYTHYAEDSYTRFAITDANSCRGCARRWPGWRCGSSPATRPIRTCSTSTPASPRRATSSTPCSPTATTWRSGSTPRARRASRRGSCTSSTTSRSPASASRRGAGDPRGRRGVLDDQALPRLRARQRALVPALVRRDDRAHARPDPPRADPRDPARRPADRVLLRARAVRRARAAPGGRRRARLGAAVRVGRRGAPAATFDRWQERFGLEIVDGIGSTEMLHIFCSNRPGHVLRGTTGFPVPGYELRLADEDGHRARGPGGGRAGGPRRLVRGLLLAPAREVEVEHAGRLVRHRRPLRAARGRRLRVRGPQRRDAQGRRPVGVARRHGERAARPSRGARRRRRRRDDRGPEPGRRVRRARAGGPPTRSWPSSCARGARSACAATSTRTSSASSTRCRARQRQGAAVRLRELAAGASVAARVSRRARRGCRVAVVGAGPPASTARISCSSAGFEVDLLDVLPTPFGLVRAGVAPDHPKIKSVTRVYEKTARAAGLPLLRRRRARRGRHARRTCSTATTRSSTRSAPPTTTGSGSPARTARARYAATRFVAWYNGHPDVRRGDVRPVRRARRRGRQRQRRARHRAHARARPRRAVADRHGGPRARRARRVAVEEVVLLGRRGPAQAAFTNPELRELGELSRAEPVVDPDELELDEHSRRWLETEADADRAAQLRAAAGVRRSAPRGQVRTGSCCASCARRSSSSARARTAR